VKLQAPAVKHFLPRPGWILDRLALVCCALLPGGLVTDAGSSISSAADHKPQAAIRLHGVLNDGQHLQPQPGPDGRLGGRLLSEFRYVTGDSEGFDSDGWSPLRILTLCTGERLAVRLQKRFSYRISAAADARPPETATLKILVAGQPARVPAVSVRSITVPDGVRDVFFAEWSSDGKIRRQTGTAERSAPPVVRKTSPATFTRQEFDLPPGPGVAELGVIWPAGGHGFLNIQLDSGNGFRLVLADDQIRIRRLGTLRVAIATASIPVRTVGRPSRLRLTLGRAVTLSLDGRVVARGTGPGESLRAITAGSKDVTVLRLQQAGSEPAPSDRVASGSAEAMHPVVLSCLLQSRVPPCGHSKPAATDQISVELRDGDVLFGNAVEAGPHGVQLRTHARHNSWDWSRICRIRFPQRPVPQLSPVAGQICRVQFTPESATAVFGRQPVTALTGAVSVDGMAVKLEHPVVTAEKPGDVLTLPWPGVRRIEPLFCGTDLLIGPEIRHLGDTVQQSFQRPVPDGLTWSIRFLLTAPPAGQAWLSVQASGLQPAAPDTLRAWPYRNRLRDGFFNTYLTVNGALAGSLNQHCRFPALSGKSARLRMPIPAGTLKPGPNVIELTLRPGPSDSPKFLDCELNRVAIELEEAYQK